MLRIKNYLPRVPPGCFAVYNMPDLLDIFLIDDFIGFVTLGFPAEPWFAGFLPTGFFAVAFFIFSPPYTGIRFWREACRLGSPLAVNPAKRD
jgi:hypothetical protein